MLKLELVFVEYYGVIHGHAKESLAYTDITNMSRHCYIIKYKCVIASMTRYIVFNILTSLFCADM